VTLTTTTRVVTKTTTAPAVGDPRPSPALPVPPPASAPAAVAVSACRSKPSANKPSRQREKLSSPATVDASTQCSPRERRMERGSSGGLAAGLIDLGRGTAAKRRAGSGSSQLSLGGEPRAPALGPRMRDSTTSTAMTTTSSSTPTSNQFTATSAGEKRAGKAAGLSSNRTSEASSLSKRVRPSQPAVKVMPARYELCETKYLVRLIADMLMELVRLNDNIPLKDGRLTRFHSR
jgi:hypothetical protein